MAQSAAAIVAIVAGFIVTRVMALSSERGAVEVRLRERRARLELVEAQGHEAEADLVSSDRESFKHAVLDRFRFAPDEDQFERIVDEEITSSYLDDAERRKEFAEVIRQRALANQFFIDLRAGDHPGDLSEYLRQHDKQLPPNAWRPAYAAAYRERRRALRPRGYLDVVEPDLPHIESIAERRWYEDMARLLRNVRSEAEWLQKEVEQLEARLRELRQPRGLPWGIASLLYFATVGIVLPIAAMPFPPGKFGLGYRVASVTLFVTGLGAVFWYLIHATWQLIRPARDA